MPTVDEVSGPYANHLLPVLPSGAGVCEVCHTTCRPEWSRCYQCTQSLYALSDTADAVNFVALSVKGEQLAYELWLYKSGREQVRARPTLGLAAVFWRWLAIHERCVARVARVDEFSMVTSVPSAGGRPDHPLSDIVGNIVQPTAHRYQTLLSANPELTNDRTPRDQRFLPSGRVPAGTSVLLVDDTWTSGAHAQSAASALKATGAGRVGIVALGRHFNREQPGEFHEPADAYYRASRDRGWDWSKCCLCDDR